MTATTLNLEDYSFNVAKSMLIPPRPSILVELDTEFRKDEFDFKKNNKINFLGRGFSWNVDKVN